MRFRVDMLLIVVSVDVEVVRLKRLFVKRNKFPEKLWLTAVIY